MVTRLMRALTLGLCLASAVPIAASIAAQANHRSGTSAVQVDLAIVNATVIDPRSGQRLASHSVFVSGGRIVAVRPASGVPAFVARRVIDGTGRFLIPGLMDMHAHFFLPEPATAPLNLLLANGVTSIREMSGDCWELAGARDGCIGEYRQLQAATRAGAIAGPEIVRITGAMVMGPAQLQLPDELPKIIAPATPEQGKELVRYLHGRRIDIIKTHDSIPADVFAAMMSEASRLKLEVSGHVPFGAGSLGAAELGYGSIEHARDLLYDCSRYGPQFRGASSDFADRKPGAAKPANAVRLSRTVDGFDEPLCTAFLAKLAGTGIYYTPTHVTREMEARASDPSYFKNPDRRYMGQARAANWEKDLKATAALPEEERRQLGRFFRHGLRVTGLAHRAGVPIMAGTDMNDTMIVPGFSIHRELGLLVEAGLSPLEALRAATSVPARYLGKSELHGGIAPGMEADLVLLNADPMADISNTRSVQAVVSDGRIYDRPALDALLAEAARIAAVGAP